MGSATKLCLVALVALLGCKTSQQRAVERGEASGGGDQREVSESIAVELPGNNPAERDDPRVPLLRIEVVGQSERPVPVPYLYGYPLYAEGPAIQGVRMLRQDNWSGYQREERKSPDGVVRVIETFPELGCTFEGIQEDANTYVPLSMECNLPPPKKRGGKRAVVGDVQIGAKADTVPKEPALAKAFLGDWHATTPGFDGSNNGAAYFDTQAGLIGFGFKKGRLTSIGFVFDPPEKRWRDADLWTPPAGVALPTTSAL